MPRFSDRTIALVRRNVNDLLNETCRIERESGGRGLMGEETHETVVVATNVSCRVIRLTKRTTSSAQDVGSQEALVERYRLICPVGTAFTVNDRVVMSDGRTFDLVDVEDGLSDEAFAGAMLVRTR